MPNGGPPAFPSSCCSVASTAQARAAAQGARARRLDDPAVRRLGRRRQGRGERVERLATEAEWSRAYAEIEDFERQLSEHRIIVVKSWLHVTADEQARRFKERAKSPYKSGKLTEDDWRNRERWSAYEQAVNEMVARTSTRHSPWHLIPANNKNYARVEIVRRACDAIRHAL